MLSPRQQVRLDAILDAAELVFTERGFQRARMSDIAEALEVTEPALYRYAESKSALFDLVLQRAASPDRKITVERIPVPHVDESVTPGKVGAFLQIAARVEPLERALEKHTRDAARELAEVVGACFDLALRYRAPGRIVSASALEWPELWNVVNEHVWTALPKRFARYLERRAKRGSLRLITDAKTDSALVTNLVVAHAVYPEQLPGRRLHEPAAARAAVVAAVVRMFVPPENAAPRRSRE